MIIRIVILIGTFLTYCVQAQNTSAPAGTVSIPYTQTCPTTVTFTMTDCPLGGQGCAIDFLGDGNFLAASTGATFSYTTPGVYNIRIQIGANPVQETLQLEIMPDAPPAFDLYSCNGHLVQVNITDTQFSQYVINYGAGPEVHVGNGSALPYSYGVAVNDQPISVRGDMPNCLANTKTIDVVAATPARDITQLNVTPDNAIVLDLEQDPAFENVLYQLETIGTPSLPTEPVYNIDQINLGGLDPDNQYYCFRLGKTDPCTGDPPVYTNTLCSGSLHAVAQNNNNQISWTTNTMGGLIDFSIEKNPGDPLPNQAAATSQYNDTDIRCGTEYTYRLVSNYPGGYKSFSKSQTVSAISTDVPIKINNISTVVNENTVDLHWLQDANFTASTYSIYKSPSFTSIGTSATPTFTDTEYNTQLDMCYQVGYDDVCGNTSLLSTPVCPLKLTGSLEDDNSVTLSWTPYTGWSNNVNSYVVQRYNMNGTLLSSVDVGQSTTYNDSDNADDEQLIFYRIVAQPNDPLVTASVSNALRIIKSNRIAYPSAFVPNSTIEENRTFRVIAKEQYNVAFEMQIFNRWGELLFATTNIQEGWDGTYKGNKMPEGTYVFIAKFTDQAGRTLKHSGNVVLLRK